VLQALRHGPCRLNARDPYAKVGVCGATIDTFQARNFARMVASGCAAHTDHGMSMLDLFREVVNGHITDYEIKDPIKLESVAKSVGIETEGKSQKDVALELYAELERTYTQVDGEIPFMKRVPEKTLETWRKLGLRSPRGDAGNHGDDASDAHGCRSGLQQHHEAGQPNRTRRWLGWVHGGYGDFRYPFWHAHPGRHRS
jgi:carbon-monoxide dehydrogenase catalytic subunit